LWTNVDICGPVAFGRTDVSELMDVIFAVVVANIAVTLAVDAV